VATKPRLPKAKQRLPIVATLSTLMFIQVLLAVVVIGFATSWNLRQGFSDYLVARDSETLDSFVAIAAKKIEQGGGLDAFRQRPELMRVLLNELAAAETLNEPAPAPRASSAADLPPEFLLGGFPPGPPGGPPPDMEAGPPGTAGARGGPPPGSGLNGPPPGSDPGAIAGRRPENFGGRVALFAPDGTRVAGFALPENKLLLSREIRIKGELVGYAKASPPSAPAGVDARFLQGQLTTIVSAVGVLLLLGLLSSWLIAKRWAAPLKDIQSGTARIAAGDLGVVLAERGSREIASAISNINTMTGALRRLETARRRWLADISHELRTPVTVLRGEIESLIDGVRQPTPQAIASLHEEVVAVAALLDDLHLVSIADLGKIQCDLRQENALELASRATDRFRGLAREKGLDVVLEISPADKAAGVYVHVDAKRIDQVLGNLLANSLKYTTAPGCIILSVVYDGPDAVIRLEDSPPAPPSADIDRLFEPFYRSDASRSRANGGSGLGLAVCRAIIEAHAGRIDAGLSDLGGLLVEIRLPAQGPAQGDGVGDVATDGSGRGR
jgi:two-component system sensor histidine kinase BaeS